jgi:deoxyribodipyrimidine photo-lyase
MKVFIFTRDLRLEDNLALNAAIDSTEEESEPVYLVFQFRKQQIGTNNDYRSDNAIEFMIESLDDLQKDIQKHGGKLFILYETSKKPTSGNLQLVRFMKHILPDDRSSHGKVFMSRGFTPFESKRESTLQSDLATIGSELIVVENHTLIPGTRDMRSGSGNMYPTFKPFYDRILQAGVPRPVNLASSRFARQIPGANASSRAGTKPRFITLKQIQLGLPRERISPGRLVSGGRTEGLIRLKAARKEQEDYKERRDHFTHQTSLLSAYHHFGCISPRESYHTLIKIPSITRQIIWRDFAHHRMAGWSDTGWKSPTTIGNSISWKTDTTLFNAWKDGKTGVPIVDAAMRQIKQEGYIHNRGRMAVANYLVKNLRLDWRLGERHFAQWLTDYDWSVNFMNWIGIAGILPTDQPLRTMNPFIQAKKFDKDLEYIQKYIPELEGADPKEVLSQERTEAIGEYPAPIVGYTTSRNEYQVWARKTLMKFHPSEEV